jgi:PRC-barrel domain
MSPRYLIAAATTLGLLAGPAFAQSTVTDPATPGGPPVLQGTSNEIDAGLLSMSLDDLEDRNVYGVDGNEIGEIEDVVRSGGDVYAVLDIDQWFDLQDEDYMVPLTEFRLEGDRLTLPITQEQAEALQQYREDGGYAELEGGTLGEAFQAR